MKVRRYEGVMGVLGYPASLCDGMYGWMERGICVCVCVDWCIVIVDCNLADGKGMVERLID